MKVDVECLLISLATNAVQWRGRFSDFWLQNAREIPLADIAIAATAVHAWRGWTYVGGAAGTSVLVPIGIPIGALEHAWSDKAEDVPSCAVCSMRITGEDDHGEIVPIRLWRKEGKEAIAMHPQCFQCVRIQISGQ